MGIMKKYFEFLREKIYIGVLLVVVFAMLGSVWGARKESKELLAGVTQEDMLISQQNASIAPELIGIFPLAAEQNKWYNFKYSAKSGIGGIVVYGMLMAVYMHWYHSQFFVVIRKCLGGGKEKYNLFLSLGEH